MTLLDRWQSASTLMKAATVVFGFIAALAGSITASVAAWPTLEPWVLVSRSLLRDHVDERLKSNVVPIQATVNELMIWKAEDGKARNLDAQARTKSDYEGWKIQLSKEPDPKTRSLMEDRVRQLDEDQRRLSTEQQQIDDRIKKLKGQ